MPDNPRDYQSYFAEGQRWCTPEEFHQILRTAGAPEEVIARIKATDDALEWHKRRRAMADELLEWHEKRKAVWTFLTRVVVAFAAMMSLLAAIRALLPDGWLW